MMLILLTLLISACGSEPQIRGDTLLQEDGFITEQPCGPPCWRGIIPGVTLWEDAVAIIRSDPTLEDLQIRVDDETGQIGAAWAQKDGDGCCQMFSQDGETVSFIVLHITPDISLGEVLEHYEQPPTYLIGELLTDSQGLVTLFYPDIPMMVYVFVAGEDGEITAQSEVVGVGYLEDDTMQLIIQSTEPGLHEWEGYKTYKDYIDSNFEVTPSITLTPSGE